MVLPGQLPAARSMGHLLPLCRAEPGLPRRLKSSPLDQIAECVRDGPLLLLKRCYQQRAHVRVVTRHARGVRGTSEGGWAASPAHARSPRKQSMHESLPPSARLHLQPCRPL